MSEPRRKPTRIIQRDAAVKRIVSRLRLASPWIQPTDGPMLRAFAQLERLALETYEHLRQEGLVRPDGTPHFMLDKYIQLRRAQTGLANALGLSSRSRIEIQSNSHALPIDAEVESALTRIDEMRKERGDGDDAVIVSSENGSTPKSEN